MFGQVPIANEVRAAEHAICAEYLVVRQLLWAKKGRWALVVAALLSVALLAVWWQSENVVPPWSAQAPSGVTITLPALDPERRYYPEAKWLRAARPELLGWSTNELNEARAHAESLGTSALVIVENGIIVDAWGDLSKRYQTRSMRKSYLSMLFGQAVARGQISLDATLEELGIDDVLALTTEERQATVYDLLTARSGVYHPANFEPAGMRRKRPPRGSHAPGSFWFYNNWDFNALGTIYERATGTSVFDAFRSEIAGPLGMQFHQPQDTVYFRGDHSVHAAYRFRLSPLDIARIGLLYLRQGRWRDRQLIPADWVARSTTVHVETGRIGFHAGYGFMWWVGDDGYAAVGARGQRLFVMPQRDLVIVHLVDADEPDRRVGTKSIRSLLDKILAAKQSAATAYAITGRNKTSMQGRHPTPRRLDVVKSSASDRQVQPSPLVTRSAPYRRQAG